MSFAKPSTRLWRPMTSPARKSWPLCKRVAWIYGKRWQSMSADRLQKMTRCYKATDLPEWWKFAPEYVLPSGLHGFMFRHREESKGFDPLKYMTPKSQFVVENFLTNFEAFCEAYEQGWRPPTEVGGRWIKRRSQSRLNPPTALGSGRRPSEEDSTDVVPVGQVVADLARRMREGKL